MKKLTLKDAKVLSLLSTLESDGCTLSPDFGIHEYCVMHDNLLKQFIDKNSTRNHQQMYYSVDNGYDVDFVITRKEADCLLKEGIHEKALSSKFIKRIGYFFVEYVYYSFVRLNSILFH